MSPIPIKLREAIVRAHANGMTYTGIATTLGVGYATVSRTLRLHREEKSVTPRPPGGGNFSPIRDHIADLLVAIVAEMSDATVAELTDVLMERAEIETSRSAVQRALGRLGFSRKKSPSWRRSATRQNTGGAGARSAGS